MGGAMSAHGRAHVLQMHPMLYIRFTSGATSTTTDSGPQDVSPEDSTSRPQRLHQYVFRETGPLGSYAVWSHDVAPMAKALPFASRRV